MRFVIMMKDPDAVDDVLEQAARNSVEALSGLNARERDALVAVRIEDARALVNKWFEHGECAYIEVDTDKATVALVQPPVDF
jgi:hypothetical protein